MNKEKVEHKGLNHNLFLAKYFHSNDYQIFKKLYEPRDVSYVLDWWWVEAN